MSKPPLVMNILVFDANAPDDAEAEQDRLVDISGPTARIWLGNFVAWAMHDNKIVEIEPAPGKTPNFTPRLKDHRHG